MGVCRQEYQRKSGNWFARYIAEWPKSDGTKGSTSFSMNLYGEEDAFELAVYCRRKGLRAWSSKGLFLGVAPLLVAQASQMGSS
jgi:hypothetical protein